MDVIYVNLAENYSQTKYRRPPLSPSKVQQDLWCIFCSKAVNLTQMFVPYLFFRLKINVLFFDKSIFVPTVIMLIFYALCKKKPLNYINCTNANICIDQCTVSKIYVHSLKGTLSRNFIVQCTLLKNVHSLVYSG